VVLATALSVLVFLLLSPASFLELSWPLVARLVWFLAFAGLAAWFGAARRTPQGGSSRHDASWSGAWRLLPRSCAAARNTYSPLSD